MVYGSSTFRSNVLYYTFINRNTEVASADHAISKGVSIYGKIPPIEQFFLEATQYEEFKLEWGYFTNN